MSWCKARIIEGPNRSKVQWRKRERKFQVMYLLIVNLIVYNRCGESSHKIIY